MQSVFGSVIISALAVIGAFYICTLVVELILKDRYKKMFIVVPAEKADDSMYEILSFLRETGPIGKKIVLALDPLDKTGEKLVEQGYCSAVLRPEELSEYICREYKNQ